MLDARWRNFLSYGKELLPALLSGLKITLYISFSAFFLAVLLGTVIALLRYFKIKGLDFLCRIYVSYFRGTPLLIQLFLFYYGLPIVFEFMQRIEKSFALVICLALNSAAYISESIRGAIEGVDPGQYEACVAFRLTKLESMYYVVLPQAAVSAIPPIMNSCLDIIKMSSLGMTIGIHDVMGRAQLAAATNYKTFETYLLAVMLYWLLAVALGSLQKKLEAKVNCAYKS